MSEQGPNLPSDRPSVPLEYQRPLPRAPLQFVLSRFVILVISGAVVVIGHALWLKHLEREFHRVEGRTIVIHSKNPAYWKKAFNIDSCSIASCFLFGTFIVVCIATARRRWGYEWIVALFVFFILWLAMGAYGFGISERVDP